MSWGAKPRGNHSIILQCLTPPSPGIQELATGSTPRSRGQRCGMPALRLWSPESSRLGSEICKTPSLLLLCEANPYDTMGPDKIYISQPLSQRGVARERHREAAKTGNPLKGLLWLALVCCLSYLLLLACIVDMNGAPSALLGQKTTLRVELMDQIWRSRNTERARPLVTMEPLHQPETACPSVIWIFCNMPQISKDVLNDPGCGLPFLEHKLNPAGCF